MEDKESNRYAKILEAIFVKYFKKGVTKIEFKRTEFSQVADELGIILPKNLGSLGIAVINHFSYTDFTGNTEKSRF